MPYRAPVRRWLKGNLHTHTTNSDGDSPPEAVAAWYRDVGYDFLALTDHDVLTRPEEVGAAAGPMLLIRGEELTAGNVHVNGLGISATVPHVRTDDPTTTVQANVDAVRAAGGIASVNHPNYRWMLSASVLTGLRDVRLFEVYNGGSETNDAGGNGHASTEGIWDSVLSSGMRMFGIAVDDAHHYLRWGRQWDNPGRGWVSVEGNDPTEAEILMALDEGRFYASTRVELDDLDLGGPTLCVDIATFGDLAYRTAFIGRGGEVLEVVEGSSPRYRVTGAEGYVRARIDDSDGGTAWLQPRFLG